MFGQSGFDTSASGMFGSPLQMYFGGLNQMSALQHDECADRLTGGVVGPADNRGLGHQRGA